MRTCTIDSCHREHDARGYCRTHYRELHCGHTPRPPSTPRTAQCSVWIKDCAWCGRVYVGRMPHSTDCSPRCSKHRHKAARRAREHNAPGTYTWADVIHLWLLFNQCCAYCERPTTSQPDPDHVVPLSRGGTNSVGNLLPSCRACNCDKRDLLLHEWTADRARRGLAPRTTTWQTNDPRTAHLNAYARAAA